MKAKLILSLLVIAGLCFVSCSDDEDEVIKDDGTAQTPDEQTPDEDIDDEDTDEDETPDLGPETYPAPDAVDPALPTFTVVPIASGDIDLRTATVKINGENLASVTVEPGTTVSYEVECAGYVSQSGTAVVTESTELKVTLAQETTKSGEYAFDVSGTYTARLGAVLDNNRMEYVKMDYPVALTITQTSAVACTVSAESPRWGTFTYNLEQASAEVSANEDESVYFLPFSSSGDRQDFFSEWDSHKDGTVGTYPLIDYSGKVTKTGEFEFYIHVQALSSGTHFTLFSGEPTGAAMVAGHYVGDLECSGFVNGTVNLQGELATHISNHVIDTGYSDELWVMMKEDPNGKLHFELLGFDLDGFSFGNMIITGIDMGSYSSTMAYSAGPLDFSTTTQIITPDGQEGYATVAGTIELEVSNQGVLGVEIESEVYSEDGSYGELNLLYIAEWANWRGSSWGATYLY